MCYTIHRLKGITMKEEILRKLYAERVEERLSDQYGWFIESCKSKNISIVGISLQDFRNRAKQCEYVLGMKPHVRDGVEVANVDDIYFKVPDKIGIRFGRRTNHKTGDKNVTKYIVNTQNIHGFGMSLSLSGWHILFNRSYLTLLNIQSKLDLGMSIEQICPPYLYGVKKARQSQPNIEYINVNGEMLPTGKACKVAGVNLTTLYLRLRKEGHKSRQEEFDSLVAMQKRSCTVKLSREDMNALEDYARQNHLTTSAALHKLIASVTY